MNLGTMDIKTRRGEKVIFLGENGYEQQLEAAKKTLKIGASYTVENIEILPWFSYVYLREFPKIAFNTVMFANLPTEEKIPENAILTIKDGHQAWVKIKKQEKSKFKSFPWETMIFLCCECIGLAGVATAREEEKNAFYFAALGFMIFIVILFSVKLNYDFNKWMKENEPLY